MRIPKYIDEALKKRTKAANDFNKFDLIVSEWICKHGFDEDIDTACFHGGVESIVNPESAEYEIREAVEAFAG